MTDSLYLDADAASRRLLRLLDTAIPSLQALESLPIIVGYCPRFSNPRRGGVQWGEHEAEWCVVRVGGTHIDSHAAHPSFQAAVFRADEALRTADRNLSELEAGGWRALFELATLRPLAGDEILALVLQDDGSWLVTSATSRWTNEVWRVDANRLVPAGQNSSRIDHLLNAARPADLVSGIDELDRFWALEFDPNTDRARSRDRPQHTSWPSRSLGVVADTAAQSALMDVLVPAVARLRQLGSDPIVIGVSPSKFNDVDYDPNWRVVRVGSFSSENSSYFTPGAAHARNMKAAPAVGEQPRGRSRIYDLR